MDVFSEIEIEALAFETQGLEQPEEFVTNDGVALEAEVISTFLGEAQYFDAFESMWQDSDADITQVIDPEAAEWLTAFIGDDTDDTDDADKSKVTFTEDEDIDEVIVTGTRPDPWVTSITFDWLAMLNLTIETTPNTDVDANEEENDPFCFDWGLDGVFDFNGDGDSNDEAQYIAAALAAGFAYVGAMPAASYFAWVAAYAQYVDANPQLGIGIDSCA